MPPLTPFPRKLYNLIEAEPNNLIEWSGDGKSFMIHDENQFCVQVLPKYFRHTRLTSFQRQLNLYGFRRLTKGPDTGAYYHPLFRIDALDEITKMKRMVRKFTPNRKPPSENEIPRRVQQLNDERLWGPVHDNPPQNLSSLKPYIAEHEQFALRPLKKRSLSPQACQQPPLLYGTQDVYEPPRRATYREECARGMIRNSTAAYRRQEESFMRPTNNFPNRNHHVDDLECNRFSVQGGGHGPPLPFFSKRAWEQDTVRRNEMYGTDPQGSYFLGYPAEDDAAWALHKWGRPNRRTYLEHFRRDRVQDDEALKKLDRSVAPPERLSPWASEYAHRRSPVWADE